MGKRGPKKGSDPFSGRGNWKTSDLTEERIQCIQWMATPREHRQFRTQKALAEALGVSPMTISNWTREPSMVKRAYKAMADGLVTVDLAKVLATQVSIATDSENRSSTAAAKLIVSFAQDALAEGEASVNYQTLSDTELREQIVDMLDELDDRMDPVESPVTK